MDSITHNDRSFKAAGIAASVVSRLLTEEPEGELQQEREAFARAAQISMLSEMTAYIAHEVNQPLAAIELRGATSLRRLARPTTDIGEVEEALKRIIADAHRASQIIGRIRAMATRRLPKPSLLSFDDDVVRESLRFLREEFQSRAVAVRHFSSLGGDHKVLGDRSQLQQVIVNLTMNAVQAMAQSAEAKRNLTIRTFAPDPATLCCSVEDSGPGLDPQHLAFLFKNFFTTKEGGMGMGLRICRTVIDAHGGKIAADNQSSHGGARFFFTLPAANVSLRSSLT